jgi:Conserved mid region of cactin
MPTEAGGRQEVETRGIKRRPTSPPPWRRSQKAPRANYESRGGISRREASGTLEGPQRDQVRLNQIQEDERSREWVAQEDDFVLKQAKKKAEIRVKDGRAQTIDWLAVALRMIDTTRDPTDDEYDNRGIEFVDPDKVLEGLSEDRLSELEKDIDTFLRLEKNAQNKEYWRVSYVHNLEPLGAY